MNSFINYIIESGISLGLFSLLFFLFLRRETYLKLNRFFLLAAMAFSVILPLLHIPVFSQKIIKLPQLIQPYSNVLESVSVYSTSVSGSIVDLLTTSQWIGLIYLLGFTFFLIRLMIRILQIRKIINDGELSREDGISIVVVEKKICPFSFLNFIFVSDDFKIQSGWEKMMAHEMEHVHQGHSFDVLILEILTALQWFNPFFWMLKRALKENHEYLADRAVIEKSGDSGNYKKLLLNQFVGDQLVIANNFNYSLIKNRMKMMSKIKSSKIANIKLLTGIVLAFALLVVFACEKKDAIVEENQEIQLKSANGEQPLILVDGEIADYDVMAKMDPKAIQSLSVNKEADSEFVKKYGDLAKNGVVSITTKLYSKDGSNNNVGEVAVVAYNKGDVEETAYEDVFTIVETMPVFPGGDLELRNHIAKSVKYPVIAQEKGIQGKVFVSFVIEKDGTVGRARVVRGVDSSLDMEALRVLKLLPKWKPGLQGGQKVAVSYTMPINFVLQ